MRKGKCQNIFTAPQTFFVGPINPMHNLMNEWFRQWWRQLLLAAAFVYWATRANSSPRCRRLFHRAIGATSFTYNIRVICLPLRTPDGLALWEARSGDLPFSSRDKGAGRPPYEASACLLIVKSNVQSWLAGQSSGGAFVVHPLIFWSDRLWQSFVWRLLAFWNNELWFPLSVCLLFQSHLLLIKHGGELSFCVRIRLITKWKHMQCRGVPSD